MAIINIQNLYKNFIDREIFSNASLIVEEKDKIGLIGNNGTGKTTLLNIISEAISFDRGDFFKTKDLSIGYLKQDHIWADNLSLYDVCLRAFKDIIKIEKRLSYLEEKMSKNHDDLENTMEEYSILQEKFQALDGYSYKSKIRGTLRGMGFSEDEFNKPVKNLSGGQKSRLSLLSLLLENHDLLLLDEPTNHLDIDAITWLEKFLKDYNKALIIISHDRYFLNNIVNKIVLLEDKNLTLFKGNYDYYVKERKKQIELKKKQYENQEKEIKRQEEIIARYLSLGRDRFIRAGKSRQKLLDKMKRLEAPKEKNQTLVKFKVDVEPGKDILKVENLEKSYKKKIFENISFEVYKNDKIGLTGPNGIGKSTIFKIITGKIKDYKGDFSLGANVKIGYFDQEMENLSLEKTVIDEIWDEYPKLSYYDIRKYLAQFLFIGDDIFKNISELSGGEKARVSILKIMLKGANFLLLDEPTNHLDIDSKEGLEDALINYEGTILAISHDRYFLNHVVNKIFFMENSEIKEYLGNYDYYLEKTKISEEEEEEYISKTKRDEIKKLEREKRQEKKLIERQKRELEEKISKSEKNLSTIDSKLETYSKSGDYEKILELTEKRESLENTINDLYEKWMEIN